MFVSTPLHRNVKASDAKYLNEVVQVALGIVARLGQLDLRLSGISEYNQRYISTYGKAEGWGLNTLMLAYLLAKAGYAREKLCILDYGAGAGSICLLAKALGIGRVIYTDIYDVSCKDATILGELLGLKADHYIKGELNDVICYLKKRGLLCNMLVSHDCLEHIYDVEGFLRGISGIPSNRLVFWMSTGANPLRPRTKRELSRVAITAEYEDRNSKWGHKKRDTLRSFLSIRQEIIRRETWGLEEEMLKQLALKTRGLREDDIRRAVRQYLATDIMPPDPDHPTNTCDPYTGNWAERLTNPYELVNILKEEGCQVEVRPLYWVRDLHCKWKDNIKAVMNLLISLSATVGIRLSAFYVLRGSITPVR